MVVVDNSTMVLCTFQYQHSCCHIWALVRADFDTEISEDGHIHWRTYKYK